MSEQLKKQLEEAHVVIEHLHERATRLQIIASNSAAKVLELEYALQSTRSRVDQLVKENDELRQPSLITEQVI